MKIGIVGLGSIGQRHMRNLLEMGETDLLGCDTRIGEPGFSCAPIQGVNNLGMLWAWKPEAVLICTPPDSHAALARAAIQQKIHTFIEKPVATNIADADALRWEARMNGVQVAVGYQLRWQLNGIARGADLAWECAQDMRAWPSQYQKDVLSEFSHEIDAAVFKRGPVEAVAARKLWQRWELKLRHLDGVSEISIQPETDGEYIRRCYDRNGKVWEFDQARNDQAYKDELVAFLGACHGGEWDDRLCTGAQAAHVVRIIAAAKTAANDCCVVTL